jgi:hypothetical protein
MSIPPLPVRRHDKNADQPFNRDGPAFTYEETTMRCMVMVRATPASETGEMPSQALLEAMGAFNEELVKAGVMLAGEGLKPSSAGVRVRYAGKTRAVVEGPFAETKELIAGFWIIQVKSKEEAVEWARRVPFVDGEVEVRQMFELEDFGDSGGLEKHIEHRETFSKK